MRIRINRAGRRKTEHGYYFKEKPITLCLKPKFEPKKVPNGCGTERCEKPDKVHLITIPLKKLYHPCQECIPCGSGYYEPGCDNFSTGCKKCCD